MRQTAVLVSTTLRCSSAVNEAAGSRSSNSPARGTNSRVCRSTTWNSSSTPIVARSAGSPSSSDTAGLVRGVGSVRPLPDRPTGPSYVGAFVVLSAMVTPVRVSVVSTVRRAFPGLVPGVFPAR